MASTEFRHESLQDLKSIGEYLRALLEGVEAGRLDLSDDRGQLALHPSGLVGLELRAERHGSHARLVLELSWTEHERKTLGGALRVRSGADG